MMNILPHIQKEKKDTKDMKSVSAGKKKDTHESLVPEFSL